MVSGEGTEDRFGRTTGNYDEFISPTSIHGNTPQANRGTHPVFARAPDEQRSQAVFKRAPEDGGPKKVFKRAPEEGGSKPVFKRASEEGGSKPVFKRASDDGISQPAFKKAPEDGGPKQVSERVPEDEDASRPVFKRAPPGDGAGQIPQMYPPQYPMHPTYNPFIRTAMFRFPKPQGTPSKSFFYMGGIGSLVLIAACGILGIVSIQEMIFFGIDSSDMMLAYIIGLMALESALVIMSVGFFGYFYNYGSQLGAATTILYIVTSVILAIYIFFNFKEYQTIEDSSGWQYPENALFIALPICTFIFIGTSFMMGAATMAWWRYPSGNPPLCVGAAVFAVIAGSFIISVFMQVFGIAYWVGVVASLLFFLVFVKNQVPQLDEETQSYKTDFQPPEASPFQMPPQSPMMPSPYMMPPGYGGAMPYGQMGGMPQGQPGGMPPGYMGATPHGQMGGMPQGQTGGMPQPMPYTQGGGLPPSTPPGQMGGMPPGNRSGGGD